VTFDRFDGIASSLNILLTPVQIRTVDKNICFVHMRYGALHQRVLRIRGRLEAHRI